MKNDAKLLRTLTLGQKNLSRRVIFCAEQDAVKALKTRDLGRPATQREIIMAKQDAVNVLKAKEFDRAVEEAQALETRNYLDGKMLKAKDLLKVGDRVQYSREFLRNTGQIDMEIRFARGTIIGLKALGIKDIHVATVDMQEDTRDVFTTHLELV